MIEVVAARPTQAFVDMRPTARVQILAFFPIVRREVRNDR